MKIKKNEAKKKKKIKKNIKKILEISAKKLIFLK